MQAAEVLTRAPGRAAGRLQTLAVISVTAVVIGIVAFVVSGPADDGVTAVTLAGVSGPAPAVGDVAPDFKAALPDGTPVSLAQYAGRPVWLTFGASWCADCRAESADIEATYERYRDRGLVVLGVFIDETAADVSSYAGRAGLTFPIAVDQSTVIATRYQTLGIPTHYFIGADGRIRQTRIGAMHVDEMDRLVAALMP